MHIIIMTLNGWVTLIKSSGGTVIYSPCHSWNSNCTSHPSDACAIFNSTSWQGFIYDSVYGLKTTTLTQNYCFRTASVKFVCSNGL